MSDEFDFVMALKDNAEIYWIGSDDMHSVNVVIYSNYEFLEAIAYAVESNDYGQTIAYAFNSTKDAIYWAENALA